MLTEKVNSAITDQMIRELRSRLQIGDLVQVLKWDGWKGQKRDEVAARRVVCPIVGIYKHLITVRLEEGYLESFTYVDLFRQYDMALNCQNIKSTSVTLRQTVQEKHSQAMQDCISVRM